MFFTFISLYNPLHEKTIATERRLHLLHNYILYKISPLIVNPSR